MPSIPSDSGSSGRRGSAPAEPVVTFGRESVKPADITGSLDFTRMTTAPVPPPPEVTGAARFRVEPAIEEAALLHAQGQPAEARARLERALAEGLPAAVEERAWLMLLELLQAQGERAAFETRSIAFAEKFLRSAPAWRSASDAGAAMLRTGGGAYVSLTGKLTAESAVQVARLRDIALKNRVLRLDFARLQGADGPGCRVLLDLLQALRRAGTDVVFNGESVPLGALARATRPGARDVDPALWLLRLEILQWQGRQAEFDEVALDYAVTYEVSPPSFEPPAPARPAAGPEESAPPASLDAIAAPAELLGNIDPLLARLESAAEANENVTLDCDALVRVDFAAAGGLLHLAERLSAKGRYIEFRHPNPLVAALLEVIGVASHATVVARS